eukprot:TRINITY_DN113737_c0_g1_i1.p1 TRINITY_DN113737_c0_g1~~TRINITY_DN113737_c0_g1_i1.p1  ORF type:complete len:156 (+),score=14.58 TRINITY_DN113737_c0_g1_i1:53-520(+)
MEMKAADVKFAEEVFAVSTGGQTKLPFKALNQLLMICGVSLLPSELEQIHQTSHYFDENDCITFPSVMEILGKQLTVENNNHQATELLHLFKLLDKEDIGIIELMDLRNAICHPAQQDPLTDAEFAALLSRAHLENQSQITVMEFMNAFLALPTQ